MISEKELEQVKNQLRKRYEDEESPEVYDFFTDEHEYDTCSSRQEAERVLEVIESVEEYARDDGHSEAEKQFSKESEFDKRRLIGTAKYYGVITDAEAEKMRYYTNCYQVAIKIIETIENRLLPDGCEALRFTNGNRVQFGDYIRCDSEPFEVVSINYEADGSIGVNTDADGGFELNLEKGVMVVRGEAPKPPELPCVDSNGEIIHEGDTVYCGDSAPLKVKEIHRHKWLREGSYLLEFENIPLRLYSGGVTKKTH